MVTTTWAVFVDAPKAWAADAAISKPVYGANEAVIISLGTTDYVRNCQQMPGAKVPVGDWIYGVSDVYVVRANWSGSSLAGADVSGEPSVIFVQMGRRLA